MKKNLQGCMKSCRSIKTNLDNVLGNRLCNRKNETISLMLWRKFKNNCKVVWKVVKALKQIWETCWEELVQKKKRYNFPYAVKKMQKYLQSCMISCKGIKTKLWDMLGNRTATEKPKQFPLCCEENPKITAKLYEKL